MAKDRACERFKDYVERVENMTAARALTIFENIDTYDAPDEEKGAAVLMVLDMPTHNSITKAQMLKVIRYLADLAFEPLEVATVEEDHP